MSDRSDHMSAGRIGKAVDSRQFLSYLGVGLIGTGGQFLVLMALVHLARLDPVLATTFGFVVGAIINYFANYHLVFRSRQGHAGTMARFFTIAAAGMGVNAGMMALCHRGFGLHYLLSQVVATGFVVLMTYLGNRLWTFSEVRHD